MNAAPCPRCGSDPTLPGHAYACGRAAASPRWRAFLASPETETTRAPRPCRHRLRVGCCGAPTHLECALGRGRAGLISEPDCRVCPDATA